MKVIGLTGGIGCGKSTVSQYLEQQAYCVLDADKIAKELTSAHSPVLDEIRLLFGKDVFSSTGELDRQKLAAVIFSDPVKKDMLDKLMHHKVIEVMLAGIKEAKTRGLSTIFVDVPLLFESGFDRYVDEIWTVHTSDSMRIKRVMLRDQTDEESVRQRIRAQMDEAEKQAKSDYVLDNSGEKEALYEQINRLLKR